jgi:hypothetical protein
MIRLVNIRYRYGTSKALNSLKVLINGLNMGLNIMLKICNIQSLSYIFSFNSLSFY